MSARCPHHPALRGRFRANVPMAKLTAWGLGGAAAAVFEPADRIDFQNFLSTLSDAEPVLVVGLGRSGLAAARLARTRGAGVTIADRRERRELELLEQENLHL